MRTSLAPLGGTYNRNKINSSFHSSPLLQIPIFKILVDLRKIVNRPGPNVGAAGKFWTGPGSDRTRSVV
jgi:hypothetical protein